MTQDIKRRASNGFVALDDQERIASYYTFVATRLPLTELTAEEARRLPRYPLMPAALLAGLPSTSVFRTGVWAAHSSSTRPPARLARGRRSSH